MDKEQRFYESLQNVFLGAKVEGTGGYIRLMQIKADYYKKIEEHLKKDIIEALKPQPDFKDELFSKLYDFFTRYFSENGSIFFNSTPFHNNTYEKVYTDEKDVILFWKTQMLYYVKTDILFKSMEISFEDFKFYIDASEIEHKKNNERREVIFDFVKCKEDKSIVLKASYSTSGKKNKFDDIIKETKSIGLTEDALIQATKTFKKQSEVDYFIHKDAKTFLQEQFKLWSYQYFWEGAKEWTADRVSQIQILKDIAYKIIDFVAQFEDELVKIWNKPKFVRNSNYVVTLDRLAEKDVSIISKILDHPGIESQIAEWNELRMVPESFDKKSIIGKEGQLSSTLNKLPIDTRFFKSIEIDIIGVFDDLDSSLDGLLIKSENYQALVTLQNKFKNKIQTIYIDPPFKTGVDFNYLDKYESSSWLSLMNDRMIAALRLLSKDGHFFTHLDENANYLGRILIESTRFSSIKEISFNTNATKDIEADLFGYKSFGDLFVLSHQTIFHVTYGNPFFQKLWKPNRSITNLDIGWLDLLSKEKPDKAEHEKIEDFDFYIERYTNDGKLELEKCEIIKGEKLYPISDLWNDIYSFTQSEMRTSENLSFSTQKPENLMRRIIQATTKIGDCILDFYAGSGTTLSTSHKLKRKWIGVEMGAHLGNFYVDAKENIRLGILGRLKNVLYGDKNFMIGDSNRRSHLSKDINFTGGGFFKYYEIEQYDDVLGKCKYEDGDLFNTPGKSPFGEYVFLKDEKLLETLNIDYDNDKVKVDLKSLYPDIDVAETLSNLKGKTIKKITSESVEFADGEVVQFNDIDYRDIRPLIWW